MKILLMASDSLEGRTITGFVRGFFQFGILLIIVFVIRKATKNETKSEDPENK